MSFPSQAELIGHLLSDILGDTTEPMSKWMGDVGDSLNAFSGGGPQQVPIKNSSVDYDYTFADLALLSDDFPEPNGTSSPGVSFEAARSDHVHPSVGAAGGVGLVTQYTSNDDGTTFSTTGIILIDINPSPTLLAGHHYLWIFKGEWSDTNVGGFTALNFLDGSNVVLARAVTDAINVRRSGTSFYIEDGTGSTVHRKLSVLSAATNSGITRGSSTPYKVLLIDLGNQ